MLVTSFWSSRCTYEYKCTCTVFLALKFQMIHLYIIQNSMKINDVFKVGTHGRIKKKKNLF